jgi:hypothetical protein
MEFTRGNQERMYPGTINTGYNWDWLQNPASTGTRVPGNAEFTPARSRVSPYATNILDYGGDAYEGQDVDWSATSEYNPYVAPNFGLLT